MSSSSESNVTLTKGNLLASKAHALVNTVNCVGVMGKGIALAFKRQYPDMFEDYVNRCAQGEVKLGQPYVYPTNDRLIVNFPTKKHWRSVSKLEDIEQGLYYLRQNLHRWGIKSIAVPPLGCGNGQLDWSVVGPTLVRHLEKFSIPVELYVPHEVSLHNAQLSLLDIESEPQLPTGPRIAPSMVALVEVLHLIEQDLYHWPVGRVMFQKIAYFATVAGIPTGLEYEAASYGPFAAGLKRSIGQLQNNGLVREVNRRRLFEVKVGATYKDTRANFLATLDQEWIKPIHRVADLMTRFSTTQAEIAATVHYTASALANRLGRRPRASEVIEAVERWKIRRQPPLQRDDIGRSVVSLATQGWIEVDADESVAKYLDELDQF